jgi:hypothetical protein
MKINLSGVVTARWQSLPATTIYPGIRKHDLWQGTMAQGRWYWNSTVARDSPISMFMAPDRKKFLLSRAFFSDGRHKYPAGSFIHSPAGTAHVPQSKEGCVILVFFPAG